MTLGLARGWLVSRWQASRSLFAERRIDGVFRKWNTNFGATIKTVEATRMDANVEPLSAADPHSPNGEAQQQTMTFSSDLVPQAFSHFSYEHSCGKQLVCDLQGVWNPEDGFVLTDPVVHNISSTGHKHENGATDKGVDGVKRFFQTHKCGPLCSKMLLPVRTGSDDDLLTKPGKPSGGKGGAKGDGRGRGG